jgi:orotidine-5'-phosphate decarboxylase
MSAGNRLIVALDTANATRARLWADAVSPHAGLLKLGLEFFLANGSAGVAGITGAPVFLDLKLHDIPNTVAGGIRSLLPLRPRMLTIHAAGGAAMIQAAHQAAATAGAGRPMILAVTVLTSLDQHDLHVTGIAAPSGQALSRGQPVSGGQALSGERALSGGQPLSGDRAVAEQVLRLGRLAIESGADGLVCSPLEVAMLRQALGPAVKLVVPGIRPDGSAAGDQARTLTPAQAVAAGADWIVVGRPITQAADPGAAAAAIAAAIR